MYFREGCSKANEYCSAASDSDDWTCCHGLLCVCNVLRTNCRCEPRIRHKVIQFNLRAHG